MNNSDFCSFGSGKIQQEKRNIDSIKPVYGKYVWKSEGREAVLTVKTYNSKEGNMGLIFLLNNSYVNSCLSSMDGKC